MPFPLIAIDIGNTRIKCGLFRSADGTSVPEPESTLGISPTEEHLSRLAEWLARGFAGDFAWQIASVNRPATTMLVDWLRRQEAQARVTLVSAEDLPLRVNLEAPDRVGIDRLLAAVAANELRSRERPAIVVDLGTAITVDLVNGSGEFEGGAILPGIGMSARAFHQFTDLLPLVPMDELHEAPEAVGKSTVQAMRSGLFWGAVGGVKELVRLYSADADAAPQLILTGGAAQAVAHLLDPGTIYAPNLTLSGIALTVASLRT